jgi:carboxylesterase type B
VQSGQLSYQPIPFTSSITEWNALASALNCTGSKLECVRDAPATEIKSILEQGAINFNPVVDNITLVREPAKARISGNVAKIPTLSGTVSQEGRVFQNKVTNVTEFIQQYFYSYPQLWSTLDKAYPAGKDGLNTPIDIASQIFTEYYFQCTEALYAKDIAAAGIPSWRYYYNATFPNAQPTFYPIAGDFHGSEIGIVFGTYPRENATAQEFALSSFLQGTWAKFVKNPTGGPGWPAIGTGPEYSGAPDEDLGLLGAVGDVHGSGVTVIRQSVVDSRCPLYAQIYADALRA